MHVIGILKGEEKEDKAKAIWDLATTVEKHPHTDSRSPTKPK